MTKPGNCAIKKVKRIEKYKPKCKFKDMLQASTQKIQMQSIPNIALWIKKIKIHYTWSIIEKILKARFLCGVQQDLK